MELYVIRHAIAVDRQPDLADEGRALTDEGRARFRDVVRGLRDLDVRFDRVVHSPWLRAVQTAELCSGLVTGETVVNNLLTMPPTGDLLGELQGDKVAVIGHSPWLEQLMAWLILEDVGKFEVFELKKGGVARLEGPLRPGRMQLTALLPPKVLRRER